jgi:hypothetical protein
MRITQRRFGPQQTGTGWMRMAQTLNGRVATASLYGPLIWMVMSIAPPATR